MYPKLILLALILICCRQKTPDVAKEINWSQEKSTEMNRDFIIEEDLRIKMYLESNPQMQTKKTGTGLRYWIYKKSEGLPATTGQVAFVQYSIKLLDGTICYSSAKDELSEFKIDKSDVETGIQEGIKKMKVGEKATFIIPSHLAHGLTGDLQEIPPLQALIVDIELIDLK